MSNHVKELSNTLTCASFNSKLVSGSPSGVVDAWTEPVGLALYRAAVLYEDESVSP